MSEKRIDPSDRKAYTREEIGTFYKGTYGKKEISAYWDTLKPEKRKKGEGATAPKAKAKVKAKVKAKASAKEKKPRAPKVDAALLEAAVAAAKATPPKTVELIAPLDEGCPGPEHFKITQGTLGEVEEGGIMVELLCVSADPYMRSRIKTSGGAKAGSAIGGFVTARVLVSKSKKWFPGDIIGASLPYTTVQVLSAEHMEKNPMMWRLTGLVDEKSASQGIGVLGMPGSTAWGGFYGILKPSRAKKGEKNGETIFISAASGAVGQLVGQLAKHAGCVVIGSAGGAAKCATLKEKFGYDHAIDYKTCADADALKAKLKECAPDGIDMYFENVGGMHFDAALASLKPGGRVAVCGCISQYNTGGAGLGAEANKLFLGGLIYTQIRIEGFICARWLTGKVGNYKWLRDLARHLKDGTVKITETETDGIVNFGTAFQSLFTGANNGKVVIRVATPSPLTKA